MNQNEPTNAVPIDWEMGIREEQKEQMTEDGHWNDPEAVRAYLRRMADTESMLPEDALPAFNVRRVQLTGRLNQLRLEVVRGIVEDGVGHIYGIGAPQCRAVVETDEGGAVRISVSRNES